MPQTRTTCPRCKQHVMADVNQLFDIGVDTTAKQRFLSGSFNAFQCPACGYQGMLSLPIVYHDPQKELLLTFFPPELRAPVNEQERQIGPILKQVLNSLPPEKRKGYLLRPQTMLTLQTMVERVLEGDGITKEMLDRQQKQIQFVQQILNMEATQRLEAIKQQEGLVDESFFALMSRLAESVVQQGDEKLARALGELQKDLLTHTEAGLKIKAQMDETQAAIKTLQETGKEGLTREKLLDILYAAPSEHQLNTMISFAYKALDYNCFQILTERIEKAQGEEQEKLIALRQRLLAITSEIEKAEAEHVKEARQLLDKLLSAPDIEKVTEQLLDGLDETFLQVLKEEIQNARQNANLDRIGKLQKVNNVIEKAAAPPPELQLLEKLLALSDDSEYQTFFSDNAEAITPEFLELFNGLIMQSQQQGQPAEVVSQLQQIYRSAMRFSMQRNLQK